MRAPARHLVPISVVVLLVSAMPGVPATRAADSPVYYFHGTSLDQANKNKQLTDPADRGTATFDTTAPTELGPDTQTTTPVANQDYAGNLLTAYWNGAVPAGAVRGLLQLKWYWSAANPAAVAGGSDVTVTVFANTDYAADSRVQPEKVIGRAVVNLATGVTPTENISTIPIDSGTVAVSDLLIQAAANSLISGQELKVHYDAVATPSQFKILDVPLPAPPTVSHETGLAFGPATIVSAHFLGAEPQTYVERPRSGAAAGATDPDRIFVDWPLSSRSQIGQLSRSMDGGSSFRLLYDLACSPRSRPTCWTGGGGDTDSEVNPFTGTVFFSDQVVVGSEALGTSTDHGDTFPVTRQFTVTNTTTAVDRQWLASVDPAIAVAATGNRLEGFLSWHLPAAGQYVVGIDSAGVPVPQPVPQILEVAQSGPMRVDSTNGPGRGWIYQSYRNSGGYKVATAPATGYADPGAWRSNHVTADQPAIFPWLALDDHGNAYAVWVTGGVVYLSASPIDDARNNPAAGGRPATYWTPKVRVTPPSIMSAVFPAVAAADPGKVAVAYMGSIDCATGGPIVSDNCPATSHWNTYAAVLPDALALARGETARVVTGVVDHRVGHRGSVCTSGTTCTGDRSLLDMLDVGIDADGRVGVVFMDNNNRLAAPDQTNNAKLGPFVQFAKQVSGPALVGSGSVDATVPTNDVADPAGDATWPNVAGATSLPALDIRSASLFTEGDSLVARIELGDASAAAMQRDLAAYNAVQQGNVPADRLQYVLRFAGEFDVFHLSMETLADGSRRFFAGRLDENDGLINPGSPTAVLGAGYHADAFAADGRVDGNVVTIRARASDLGLAAGSRLFGATAFSMAGPSETLEQSIATPMRTVDASRPFDPILEDRTPEPTLTPIDCADPAVASAGGWHVLDDSRAGDGTLCRAMIGGAGTKVPTMELRFTGEAVDLIVARGPRGGLLDVSIDGGTPQTIDLWRAPANPAKPDTSGRKDLDFGVSVHFDAGSAGEHVLRISARVGAGDTKRDMAYVDGFVVVEGALVEPPPGTPSEQRLVNAGHLAELAAELSEVVVEEGVEQVTLILEAAPDVSISVVDSNGEIVASADASDGVAVIRLTPTGPATYALVIDAGATFFTLWEVFQETR